MKKYALLFSAFLILFAGCKKDDPKPNNNYTPPKHYQGDVAGWVTVNGVKSIVSGGSKESVYGFIMTPRNMTPANSYPILTINFDSKPTADNIYDLFNISPSVSVTTASSVQYFASKGNLNVSVKTDSIVSSFENLVAKKLGGSDTITISGSATYYSKDIN